jgi:hypothetical protein
LLKSRTESEPDREKVRRSSASAWVGGTEREHPGNRRINTDPSPVASTRPDRQFRRTADSPAKRSMTVSHIGHWSAIVRRCRDGGGGGGGGSSSSGGGDEADNGRTRACVGVRPYFGVWLVGPAPPPPPNSSPPLLPAKH